MPIQTTWASIRPSLSKAVRAAFCSAIAATGLNAALLLIPEIYRAFTVPEYPNWILSVFFYMLFVGPILILPITILYLLMLAVPLSILLRKFIIRNQAFSFFLFPTIAAISTIPLFGMPEIGSAIQLEHTSPPFIFSITTAITFGIILKKT